MSPPTKPPSIAYRGPAAARWSVPVPIPAAMVPVQSSASRRRRASTPLSIPTKSSKITPNRLPHPRPTEPHWC
ncbi:hypothetical protein ABZP36_003795 [Zizania latifolia]